MTSVYKMEFRINAARVLQKNMMVVPTSQHNELVQQPTYLNLATELTCLSDGREPASTASVQTGKNEVILGEQNKDLQQGSLGQNW